MALFSIATMTLRQKLIKKSKNSILIQSYNCLKIMTPRIFILKGSVDCVSESDCEEDKAFCHPKIEQCVCTNGATTYPFCSKTTRSPCSTDCSELEYCDLKVETCLCKWGGSPPRCAAKKCESFQVLKKGECECLYGNTGDGQSCRKCVEDCGDQASCTYRRG